MASFDIVNKPDFQRIENGVNVSRKEISTRFDFKGAEADIELDIKNKLLKLHSISEMKIEALVDVLLARLIKQGVDPKTIDLKGEITLSGKIYHKTMPIYDGLDKETAKKLVKLVKDSGLKVQAAIMDDIVRITGKKIDDLQAVIVLARQAQLDRPLQFVNMKS
jgi:cyclic-di-GMP-binding protein